MRAEGWVIKGSKINQSDKIATLCRPGPLCPIRVYLTLAASVDSWGMMEGDKWTLKAELGRKDEHHGPDDFLAAVEELIEVGLVTRWWIQSNPWIYVVGHDEENGAKCKNRSKRPQEYRPPLHQLNQGGDLGDLTPILDRSKSGLRSNQDPDPSARAEVEVEVEKGKGRRERIPTPSPQKSDKDRGPTTNPDPLPLARPGHLSDPPQPPGDAGKGTSSEADHRGQAGDGTRPRVSPSNAGRPREPADPGGGASTTPPAPVGARPPKKIHVIDQAPDTPGDCSTPDPQQSAAQDRAEASCRPRGDSPSRLSEILESQIGDRALIPTRADSNELVEVQELQQYYANTWGREIAPVIPRGDNLTRILEVLRHPAGGWDVCKAAIRGHHKIASKDGAQHGREFRHVFPPVREGNRTQTAKVDLDRVFEYARHGRPPRRRVERKPEEPKISREEAEAAAKKGLAAAREAINKEASG